MRRLSDLNYAATERYRKDLAREVAEWRAAVEADLGGDLSAQEATVLDVAQSKLALMKILGRWIQNRPTRVVDGRSGRARGIVTDFLRAAESVERSLDRVGYKRRAREVGLGDYLREAAARTLQSGAAGQESFPVIDVESQVTKAKTAEDTFELDRGAAEPSTVPTPEALSADGRPTPVQETD